MIDWDTEKPEGTNHPAAQGKALNCLLKVLVYWQNTKSYFEGHITGGARSERVPGEFDTLAQAKAAAEDYTTKLIKDAAAGQNSLKALLDYLGDNNFHVAQYGDDGRLHLANDSKIWGLIDNFGKENE